MKSHIVRTSVLAFAFAIAAAPIARAQFGNFNLPGTGGTSPAPAVSADDFSKLLETTTSNVLGARIQFLRSQADFATALGLKNESLIKAAEALSAVSGPSTSPGDKVKAIKDSEKKTADAQKSVKEGLAKSETLSDESKAKFLEGTGKFITAIMLEKEQIATIKKLVDQGKALTSSASPFGKIKAIGLVKPATELATMVPGDISEGMTVFGQITSFAAKHNIAMPSQAESMKTLGEGP